MNNPPIVPRGWRGSTWKSADDGEMQFEFSEGSDNGWMTLRDYFAGQALKCVFDFAADSNFGARAEHVASMAYELADAMLKHREQK